MPPIPIPGRRNSMGLKGSSEDSNLSQATLAVHAGEVAADQPFGAVVSPVLHSLPFAFTSFDEMRRYARGELPGAFFYSRYGNPTVAEVERKIAALEGAEACVVTSSGSAATFCALAALCREGDEVIASDSVYGGTVKLLTNLFSGFGIRSRFIAIDDIPNLSEIAVERTKAFW